MTISLRSRQFNEGPVRTPQDSRSFRQHVWSYVSRSPLRSLWNLQGVPVRVIVKNTWNSMFADNLLGRSAELGFYFIFALFPTLVTACSILGLAARSAVDIYEHLLLYLWIVVPPSALGTVLEAFHQTTAAASSGKLTFGLVAALWSASVGFSAIQGSLNVVYRVQETRPYWKARLSSDRHHFSDLDRLYPHSWLHCWLPILRASLVFISIITFWRQVPPSPSEPPDG